MRYQMKSALSFPRCALVNGCPRYAQRLLKVECAEN